MRRATKIWLITAASLTVLGLVLFVAVMTAFHWDFAKLSTVKYETNTYEVSDAFSKLSVNTDTADVLFLPSDDGKCRVVCYEQEKAKHSVSVRDGVLTVNVVDEKKWYDYIGIMIGTPKITVYLPQTEYASMVVKGSTGDVKIPKDFRFASIDVSTDTGDVTCRASASGTIKIKTSTGNIRVENLSVGALNLSVATGDVTASSIRCEGKVQVRVSTGDTRLTDVVCQTVASSGDTGDVSLKNVIVAGKLSVERDTGDVSFEKCDAAEIFVETDTGDVTGSLLTEKVFSTKTDTGHVKVPNSNAGGKCRIVTDTGDIKISIVK